MKHAAPLVLALLFLSCSSSTDVIDKRVLGCEPGQDIDIMVGLDNVANESTSSSGVDLVVDVGNNSHGEVTVKFVRMEQIHTETALYHIDPVGQEVNQLIPENDDFTFRLPTFARSVPRNAGTISGSRGIEMIVSVGLTNGDLYRCQFAVSVR